MTRLRFFFQSSVLMMIALLILLPFINRSFQFLWAILFWAASWLATSSWIDLVIAAKEQHEREADTKKPSPSENGAEAFGKRDTTDYMIEKGRTNRW